METIEYPCTKMKNYCKNKIYPLIDKRNYYCKLAGFQGNYSLYLCIGTTVQLAGLQGNYTLYLCTGTTVN